MANNRPSFYDYGRINRSGVYYKDDLSKYRLGRPPPATRLVSSSEEDVGGESIDNMAPQRRDTVKELEGQANLDSVSSSLADAIPSQIYSKEQHPSVHDEAEVTDTLSSTRPAGTMPEFNAIPFRKEFAVAELPSQASSKGELPGSKDSSAGAFQRLSRATQYPFFEETRTQFDLNYDMGDIDSYEAGLPLRIYDQPTRLFSRSVDSYNQFFEGESLSSPCIEVRNLYKSYYTRNHCRKEEVKVLRGLNMTVMKRSIFGLLGPSGCGKTTLIECILGRANYTSGYVRVFESLPGHKLSGIPGQSVGFMPQDYTLYEDLTIFENCIYFAELLGMRTAEAKERIKTLMPFLHLPEDKRLVRNLSGGQKRRTSFMLAILHDPPLLILDEPTVGVDPDLRKSMWSYLKDLTILKYTTVLVTTHYIEECRQADKVGMMSGGVLIIEEHPTTLMERYNSSNLEDIFLKLCLEQLGEEEDETSDSPLGDKKITMHGDITALEGTRPTKITKKPPYRSMEAEKKLSGKTADESSNSKKESLESAKNDGGTSAKDSLSKQRESAWRSRQKEPPEQSKSKLSMLERSMYSLEDIPDVEFPRGERTNSDVLQRSKSVPIHEPNTASVRYFTTKADILEQLKAGRRGSDPIPRTGGILNFRRLKAIVIKNIIKLLRNPALVLFELINPALQIIIFCLTMGVDPHDLSLGKLNQDRGLKVGSNTVNFGDKFLKRIDNQYVDLKDIKSIQEGKDKTYDGNSWGYILVPPNFTSLTMIRMQNPSRAINSFNSTIHVHLDMTSSMVDFIIFRTLRDAQQESLRDSLKSASLNPNLANDSLQIEQPIYGSKRGEFKEFMIAGVILTSTYFISVSTTATQVILENLLGLNERSYLSGMTILEMILGLLVTQVAIICSQAALMMIVAFAIFQIKVFGAYFLVFLFALIEGLCGMCFGLILASVSNKPEDGLTLAEGSYFPCIMMSGTIWPLEAQPNWFRYIAYCTNPQLFPTQGLYGIITRGWGLSKWQVYWGLIASIGWTLLYISIATVLMSLKSKK